MDKITRVQQYLSMVHILLVNKDLYDFPIFANGKTFGEGLDEARKLLSEVQDVS